jgi:hypothetical protein
MRSTLMLLLVACGGEISMNERTPASDDSRVVDTESSDETSEDFSHYDGATLRIVQPRSATFLPWGGTHAFQAELRASDGTLLQTDAPVSWSSSVDSSWSPASLSFSDDRLDVGVHDLTVEMTLPNGDRLAHTVGGVLVQSESAGTYVGTISANFTFQSFPVNCAGAATLIVDPYGRDVSGTATCLGQAGSLDLPIDFVIDADHESGPIDGVVKLRLFFFDIDFDAEGSLGSDKLNMDFEGDILTSDLDGRIRTQRVSRDAGR